MTLETQTDVNFDADCDCKYCKIGRSEFCEIEREERRRRYPSLKDHHATLFYASDAGGLQIAAEETICALRRHGLNEHATAIKRSMARFASGSSFVRIKTLRRWDDLFDEAYILLCLSPISDPGIADFTADNAHSYIIRELRALQAYAESQQVRA
jgi:hypothetical protein